MQLKSNNLTCNERVKLSSFFKWILDVGEGKVSSLSLDMDEEPTLI